MLYCRRSPGCMNRTSVPVPGKQSTVDQIRLPAASYAVNTCRLPDTSWEQALAPVLVTVTPRIGCPPDGWVGAPTVVVSVIEPPGQISCPWALVLGAVVVGLVGVGPAGVGFGVAAEVVAGGLAAVVFWTPVVFGAVVLAELVSRAVVFAAGVVLGAVAAVDTDADADVAGALLDASTPVSGALVSAAATVPAAGSGPLAALLRALATTNHTRPTRS